MTSKRRERMAYCEFLPHKAYNEFVIVCNAINITATSPGSNEYEEITEKITRESNFSIMLLVFMSE